MSQWHTRQLLLSPLGTKNGSLADTPDHSVPFWKGASMLVPRSRADKSVCHVYERKEGSCCSKRWGLYCGVHGTSRMLLYHFPETILRGTMPNQDTFHLQLRNHSLHLRCVMSSVPARTFAVNVPSCFRRSSSFSSFAPTFVPTFFTLGCCL